MRVTRKRITTRILNLRSAEDIFIGGWAKIEFRTSLFYQLCFSSRPSKPLKLGVCSTRRRLDQFCPFVLLFSSSRGNAVENCNSVFRLNVSTDSGTKAIQACRHVSLAVTVRSFYKKAYVLSCTVVWKNNIQKNNLNARLILLWRSTKTTSDILNRCFFKDDIFQQSWKYSETKNKMLGQAPRCGSFPCTDILTNEMEINYAQSNCLSKNRDLIDVVELGLRQISPVERDWDGWKAQR